MYSTYPSSSFKLDVYTLAQISEEDLQLISFYIIFPWRNFTISNVTIKEIGTKFLNFANLLEIIMYVNNIIHAPILTRSIFHVESSISFDETSKYNNSSLKKYLDIIIIITLLIL